MASLSKFITKSCVNRGDAVLFALETLSQYLEHPTWTIIIRQEKSGRFSVAIATVASSDDTQTQNFSDESPTTSKDTPDCLSL